MNESEGQEFVNKLSLKDMNEIDNYFFKTIEEYLKNHNYLVLDIFFIWKKKLY